MSRNDICELNTMKNFNLIYRQKDTLKKYNLICVCLHDIQCDLKGFIRDNNALFDGIVIIDSSPIIDNNFISSLQDESKLVAYYHSNYNNVTIEIISKITKSILKTDWICLLYSNERLVKGYDNIKKVCEESSHMRQIGIILTSENDTKYFIKNKKKSSVVYENRLYLNNSISVQNAKGIRSALLIKKIIIKEVWQKYKIDFFTIKNDISELVYKNEEFVNYNLLSTNKLKYYLTKEIKEISEYFINRTDYLQHIGILGGESGTSLLYAQLFLNTGKSIYVTKLKENLNFLIELINRASKLEPITPYFSNGLAGFGWLLCYIKELKIIEIPENLLEQIDSILSYELKRSSDMPMDILHGQLGIIRYFIKRSNNKELIAEALYTLRKTVIIDNNEYRWLSQDPVHLAEEGQNFDCGIAHGMAGILYFLGKSYELGIERDLCTELGNGIIMFYLNNEQSLSTVGSFYPYRIRYKKTSKTPAQFSRLAWCYGDLSILYSIYLYSLKIGETKEINNILEKLRQTTLRKNCESNGVHDSMICHGAAGIAHLYNRLYFMTNIIEFKEAAQYWLKVSVIISRDESVNPPFKFVISAFSKEEKTNKNKWDESLGLLEGVIGVELVFLSFLNYEHINWDEIIMLS